MTHTIIRSAISSLPSVGIIQLFKDNDIRVIGTDLIVESAGRKNVDKFYVVPKANNANEIHLVKLYSKIVRMHKVSTILSGPENEILLLAKNEDEFIKRGCKLFHPDLNSLKTVTDKYALYKTFSGNLNCGKFYLASEFNLKCCGNKNWVLKPRNGRGSSGILFLNASNFNQYKNHLKKQNLVQEKLMGQEYTVDFLCDFDGKLINCVPRKRLWVDSGISIVSETVKILELIEAVKVICELVYLRGFNCVQFIESEGMLYLTDLNPRIGGGSILSLNASESLKTNMINLLKSKPVKKNISLRSFKKLSMYRYYSEMYQ